MKRDQPAGHRKRLRERFLRTGTRGMADHELIELVLTLVIPRSDVKPQAKTLIGRFGNLRGILDAPFDDLRRISGVGTVTPVALRIIKEVATLYLQQSVEGVPLSSHPEMFHDLWRMRIGSLPNEVFEVGYLDAAGRLVRDGIATLEEGTLDRTAVYPRKVIAAALLRGAAGLVFAHNHPNGDRRPSDQDKLLTRALVLAAETVQIRVFDHLIVGGDKVFSFRAEGLL
ncbi:MAG: JAB domain-containing protein [Candidatus Methylomirabilia bacterium]